MAWDDKEDTTLYQAVVNHGQQYSIWRKYRATGGQPARTATNRIAWLTSRKSGQYASVTVKDTCAGGGGNPWPYAAILKVLFTGTA
jgi:hypothetical protein